MNFLSKVLKPVELKIVSNKKVTDLKTFIEFIVTFEIKFFFNTKNLRFETRGEFETGESINQKTLGDIINATDYNRYIDLNMKNRGKGHFEYSYLYRDNWLTITYKTF